MLIPFEAQNVDYVLEFGEQYIRFYKDHQPVKADNVFYEVSTPYSQEDLETLRYIQNGDYLYLFHRSHPIKTLAMYGETDWRLEEFTLKNGPWDSVNTDTTSMLVSDVTGSITITSDAAVFSENDIGRLVRITCKNSQKKAWQASKSVSKNEILYSDGKYYKAQSAGTTGSYKPVHTEGTVSDGSILFTYLHAGYGTARITAYTDSTHVTAMVIDRFPDEITSVASDYWELGLIYQGGEYPMCGTFFRNRFCFLFDNKGIPTVCMSNSDDYDNFADKEHGEVLATNAITQPLVSDRRNEPCWLVSGDVLFVGTSAAEFYIDSAASSEALAPDNVKMQKISNVGSKPITPVKIGAHTIFVTKSGTSIRDIVYSFNTDSYDPIDLSIFGRHLLAEGIIDMCYQEYPDKIIWLTMKNGRLIGLTFSSEEQVNGAHQHYVSGSVKDLTVIHNYNNNLDELWSEITRYIAGDEKTSVEWFDNGIPTSYPDEISVIDDVDEKELREAEYMKNNCYYVDGGIEVIREENPLLNEDDDVSITGLDHLEGAMVAIQTNGAEQKRQIVTQGAITVKNKYTRIKVGLPISSQFKPQNIYIQANNGSGIGDVQRIDHVTLMLWRSLSGKVGKDYSSLQDIYFRQTDEPTNQSSPLYTGNKEIPVDMSTTTIKEKGATVLIFNDSVFPMNILAIAPHFTTSGNGK